MSTRQLILGGIVPVEHFDASAWKVVALDLTLRLI